MLSTQADTMTTTELANFRTEVRAALQRAAKQSGRDIMYTFSPAAVAESHTGPQAGPFAIICSRQMDLKVGRWVEHRHILIQVLEFWIRAVGRLLDSLYLAQSTFKYLQHLHTA